MRSQRDSYMSEYLESALQSNKGSEIKYSKDITGIEKLINKSRE